MEPNDPNEKMGEEIDVKLRASTIGILNKIIFPAIEKLGSQKVYKQLKIIQDLDDQRPFLSSADTIAKNYSRASWAAVQFDLSLRRAIAGETGSEIYAGEAMINMDDMKHPKISEGIAKKDRVYLMRLKHEENEDSDFLNVFGMGVYHYIDDVGYILSQYKFTTTPFVDDFDYCEYPVEGTEKPIFVGFTERPANKLEQFILHPGKKVKIIGGLAISIIGASVFVANIARKKHEK